jgi:ribosomal protein L37AE/L43A
MSEQLTCQQCGHEMGTKLHGELSGIWRCPVCFVRLEDVEPETEEE